MSYWEHSKPVLRTRAVDACGVARAAIALLDEGGLRALTVRAVAGRLGVAPASLYSRVETVDDVFDLALDEALGGSVIRAALAEAGIVDLMLVYFRHLALHPWVCQVIGMRAPRGPNYLRLSERMITLLTEDGASDPLGAAYTLSNFVIGSAITAPMANHERNTPIDPEVAPCYAQLHAEHTVDPELIVTAGLAALHARVTN